MKKIKFVIIGETQVGKTSLINQYVNNQFEGDYLMTIGNDKTTKEITIDEKKVTLEIWDTIGNETLRAANKIFMKNTNIALNQFYEELISINTENKMIIGVTANKSDLYENAEVTKEEGEDYANKIKASFFESTATDHENVENIFNELTKDYIDKYGLKEETTQSNNNSQTTNIVNDEKVDIPENKQEAVKSMVIEKIDEVETVESSCYDKFSKKCNIF